MSTTITTETTQNVKTIAEAQGLMNAAFGEHGENLKSISLFVWADKAQGVEVKVSATQSTKE